MNEVEELAQEFKGRPLVVLAPHPDDEVIGCHLLMSAWRTTEGHGDINLWFFSEIGRLNNGKAVRLSLTYAANHKWIGLGADLKAAIEAALPHDPVFAVPNTLDHHPLHRAVTKAFHLHVNPLVQDVIYYSVSKNTPTLTVVDEVELPRKKAILRDIYPKEKLWEKDESFVLFESYQRLPGEQWIWVTTEFVGFHYWSGAPVKESFLHHIHRHVFKVKLKVSAGHANCEVEFFDLQGKLNSYIALEFNGRNLGEMSCEMIAIDIARNMMACFGGHRRIEVTVSEDGENGATIKW